MFKFSKEKNEEQSNFVKGLSYGLGGALIVLVIILAILFGGSIKDKFTKTGSDPDLADLRFTVIAPKDCENCWDVNLFFDALSQYNTEEIGRETLYIGDKKADNLIDEYEIAQLPTILISGELDKDETLQQLWPNLGEIIDGVFVFRQVIPPFVEVESGDLRGEFSAIYLDDSSCEDCYDVMLHKSALQNMGLVTESESLVDVSSAEGQSLVDKYSIESVPTVLLNGDLDVYQTLKQIWPMYGEVADDGTYIFTGMEEMGNYRDLVSGEVVEVSFEE